MFCSYRTAILVAFDVITINEPPSLFPLPQLRSEKDEEPKPIQIEELKAVPNEESLIPVLDEPSLKPKTPKETPLISDESKGSISSKTSKYECTKISEQETKCEIVYNDKYEPITPITPSSNYSVAELKRYTFDLINQDRKALDVQPMLLGNNKLADDHATYLWEEKAIYHLQNFIVELRRIWGQNLAVRGYDYNVPDFGIYCPNNDFHLPKVKDRVPDVCKGTHAYCKGIDPKNVVASAQYNFMYNDAEWDWDRGII